MNNGWDSEDFRSAATRNRRRGTDFAAVQFEEKLGPERRYRSSGPESTGEYPHSLSNRYAETIGERAKRTPRSCRQSTPDYMEKSPSLQSRSRSQSRNRGGPSTPSRRRSTPRSTREPSAESNFNAPSRQDQRYRCDTPRRGRNQAVVRKACAKTPVPSAQVKDRTKNVTAKDHGTARLYRLDEKILCRAEDGLYYEAKIIKVTREEDGSCSYNVHFMGWNKTYDETVHQNEVQDRFHTFSAESLRQAQMAQTARREMVILGKKNREKLRKGPLGASSSSKAGTPRKSGVDKARRSGNFAHTMPPAKSVNSNVLRHPCEDTALRANGNHACSNPTLARIPVPSVAPNVVSSVENQITVDYARLHLEGIGQLANLEDDEIHELRVPETTPDRKLSSQLEHIRMVGELMFMDRSEKMWMRVPNEGPLADTVKRIKEALSDAKAILQSPNSSWNEYFAAKSDLQLMIDNIVDSANKALGGGSENDERSSGDFVQVPEEIAGNEEVVYVPDEEEDVKPVPVLRRL